MIEYKRSFQDASQLSIAEILEKSHFSQYIDQASHLQENSVGGITNSGNLKWTVSEMMERYHFNAFLNESVNIRASIAGHDVSDLSMYEIMYCSNFNNYVNDAKQIQNDAVRKKVVIQYLASNIITTANPKQNCQNVAALAGDSTGIRNVCGNDYCFPVNTMQPVQRNIDSTLQHHLNINPESSN